MPYSFAETNKGLLLLANGLNGMSRWDGFSAQVEPAGLAAPATASVLTGALGTPNNIVGTYYAHVRYVDRLENYSNLSPISASWLASIYSSAITGFITGTPITITAPGHGRATNDRVAISGCYLPQANGDWTVFVVNSDTLQLAGSSALSRAQSRPGGSVYSGVGTVFFTSLPVPTDPKVARRQLLRNTNGQTSVFYVDIDTTDLTSTVLTSTKTDAVLATQTAVALLDADGKALANRFGMPPDYKGIIATYLDRTYAAKDVEYGEGNILITSGSAAVWGIGTEWTAQMLNRYLYVLGGNTAYKITAVTVATQGLTLQYAYVGATNLYATYKIRPAPAERRLIYYSEAGLPEAFPATNSLQLQTDGDDITGLMARHSFLYILERNHIYRFTTLGDPARNGSLYLASGRGCINNRCWVIVEDAAYLLDERGAYLFSADGDIQDVSDVIQPLFRNESALWRINWAASSLFHACLDQQNHCVRWFVCLGGQYLPHHALCFDYRHQRWWIEEFPVPIGASCVGLMDGHPQIFYGSNATRTWAANQGTLDGLDSSTGTVRGLVTAAGWRSLTDSLASWPASKLVANPVAITQGRGKGQRRIITAVSGNTLTINTPWTTIPNTTSVYQLGGISWKYATKWFHIADDEQDNPRRMELLFRPLAHSATMDVRKYFNLSATPDLQQTTVDSSQGEGLSSIQGESDLVVDLTFPGASVDTRFDGSRERYAKGLEYLKIELAGVQNKDRVEVFELTLDGVENQ